MNKADILLSRQIYHSELSDEIVMDLKNLCKVFYERFICGGLVQPDSIVVFNPSFRIASYACGGADADLYRWCFI